MAWCGMLPACFADPTHTYTHTHTLAFFLEATWPSLKAVAVAVAARLPSF